MPTYNPNVKPAGSSQRTPGNWLCKIEREATIRHEARAGIIVTTTRTPAADEIWKMVIRVIDDHPEAPAGAMLFENIVWNKQGTERGYALLAACGHDLGALGAGQEIVPEMLYERPFVMALATTADGFLEADGWNPYLPADTANRGPVPGRKVKPGRDGAGAGGAGGAKAPSASTYGYGDLPPARAGAAGASATGASAGAAGGAQQAPLPWETF